MSWQFTPAEEARIAGLHPDLQKVVRTFKIEHGYRFKVLEGRRTLQRQRELLKRGATTTLNSRHLTGHAVDLAPIIGKQVSWHWPHYYPFATAIKATAGELRILLNWGGDWPRFKDGPHWELSWAAYPK